MMIKKMLFVLIAGMVAARALCQAGDRLRERMATIRLAPGESFGIDSLHGLFMYYTDTDGASLDRKDSLAKDALSKGRRLLRALREPEAPTEVWMIYVNRRDMEDPRNVAFRVFDGGHVITELLPKVYKPRAAAELLRRISAYPLGASQRIRAEKGKDFSLITSVDETVLKQRKDSLVTAAQSIAPRLYCDVLMGDVGDYGEVSVMWENRRNINNFIVVRYFITRGRLGAPVVQDVSGL